MEEREQLRILGEAEAVLAQKSQALQELVMELERRSRGSALELLQVSRPLPEARGGAGKWAASGSSSISEWKPGAWNNRNSDS